MRSSGLSRTIQEFLVCEDRHSRESRERWLVFYWPVEKRWRRICVLKERTARKEVDCERRWLLGRGERRYEASSQQRMRNGRRGRGRALWAVACP